MNEDKIKDNPYEEQMQQLNQRFQQGLQSIDVDLKSEQNPTQLNEAVTTVKRKWSPGQYINSQGKLSVNSDDVIKNGYTFLTDANGKLQMVDKNNGYKVIVRNVDQSPEIIDWIDKNGLWDKAENFNQSSQRMTVSNKDAIQQVRDDMRWGNNVAGASLAAVTLAPTAAEFALNGFGLNKLGQAAQKGTKFLVDKILPNTNLGTLGESFYYAGKVPTLLTSGYKYPLLFANTGLGAGVNAAQMSYYGAEGLDQLKRAFDINDNKAFAIANGALALSPFLGMPGKTFKNTSNVIKKTGQWFAQNVIPEKWTNLKYLFQYGPKKSWRNLTTRINPEEYLSNKEVKQIVAPDLYIMDQQIINSSEFDNPTYVRSVPFELITPTQQVKFGDIVSDVTGQTSIVKPIGNTRFTTWKFSRPSPRGFLNLFKESKNIDVNRNFLLQSRFSNPEIIGAVRTYENDMNKVLNGEGLVTGSTVGIGRGFIQNQINNDTEIITTASRLNKAKNNIHFQQTGINGLGDEKGVSEFAQGNTNGVDFDIIQENENGQAVGKLAHQIYATLHPEEANKLYKAHELQEITSYDIPLPVSAEQLFQELKQGDNVAKVHLSDVLFMGSNLGAQNPANAKQGYRAYNLLTMPEQQSAIESAILTKGKSLFGPTWQRPSAQITKFDDIEANKRFLQEVINENSGKQYFSNDQINEIAKNPKQMQNIFDIYYMNNFYGLRAQNRNIGDRNLTNEELLKGFTENVQYGGGTGSGAGQNHTSGGITAFNNGTMSLNNGYPFRSVRIGKVSYKPNLTLDEFTDQVKRITDLNNFGPEYYKDQASVYSVSQLNDLPMWRSMTTNRGVGAYGGSYVGMLDLQPDPSKYLILKNWNPETGLTFSNKWEPFDTGPIFNDKSAHKTINLDVKGYSPEYENLLNSYYDLYSRSNANKIHQNMKLLRNQSADRMHLQYRKKYDINHVKDKLQNTGIMSGGLLGLFGLGYYATSDYAKLKDVEKRFNYTLERNPKYSEDDLQMLYQAIDQKPDLKTNLQKINYMIPILKDYGYNQNDIKSIIRYFIDSDYK